MPSFKVLIAEKDGVEFEYNTEYDLLTALIELGVVASAPFDEDKLLTNHLGDVVVNHEGNVVRRGS
jgi:hypothetical protein